METPLWGNPLGSHEGLLWWASPKMVLLMKTSQWSGLWTALSLSWYHIMVNPVKSLQLMASHYMWCTTKLALFSKAVLHADGILFSSFQLPCMQWWSLDVFQEQFEIRKTHIYRKYPNVSVNPKKNWQKSRMRILKLRLDHKGNKGHVWSTGQGGSDGNL